MLQHIARPYVASGKKSFVRRIIARQLEIELKPCHAGYYRQPHSAVGIPGKCALRGA